MKKQKVTRHSEVEDRVGQGLQTYKMTFYVSLFSSGVIFLYLLIAHLVTPVQSEIYFSKYFSYSTAILLISSYPLSRMIPAFDREHTRSVTNGLYTACGVSILFILLQIAGLQDVFDQNEYAVNRFIYVLSGLHLLYVVAISITTFILAVYFGKKFKDPVKRLITVTNPFERMKIEMAIQAWYFINVTWGVIYVTLNFFS